MSETPTPVRSILRKPGQERKEKNPIHISVTAGPEGDEKEKKGIVRKGTGHRKRPSGSPIVRKGSTDDKQTVDVGGKNEEGFDDGNEEFNRMMQELNENSDTETNEPGPVTDPEPVPDPALNLSPTPKEEPSLFDSLLSFIQSPLSPTPTQPTPPQPTHPSPSPQKAPLSNTQNKPERKSHNVKSSDSPIKFPLQRKIGLSRSLTFTSSTNTSEAQLSQSSPNLKIKRSDSLNILKNQHQNEGKQTQTQTQNQNQNQNQNQTQNQNPQPTQNPDTPNQENCSIC